MSPLTQIDSSWLPLLIFVARVVDVSLGTLRIICVMRGYRRLSVLLAFFEILIWVYAITSVVSHLDHFVNVVAYAGGFAAGNWLGMWIEQRLALGLQVVTLFSRGGAQAVAEGLRFADMVVTTLTGGGREGPVTMCLAVVPRKQVPIVVKIARGIDPDVLITVADVRQSTFPHIGTLAPGKMPLRLAASHWLGKPRSKSSAA